MTISIVWQGQRKYGSDESAPIDWIVPPGRTSTEPGVMSTPGLSEMFAYHSTSMANTIRTSLIVFSRLVRSAKPALIALSGNICLIGALSSSLARFPSHLIPHNAPTGWYWALLSCFGVSSCCILTEDVRTGQHAGSAESLQARLSHFLLH